MINKVFSSIKWPFSVKGPRVLFILKDRQDYNNGAPYSVSSGLFNSAYFAAELLAANGFTAKVVEVVDNNSIDHEVDVFKPNIVVIEALWVVPGKFDILQQLHPTVTWIVRVHSEAPFLAQEGIAIDWLSRYPVYSNVYVGVNSVEELDEMLSFYPDKRLPTSKLLYLPTFYPITTERAPDREFSNKTVNVACMGMIRQLKNTLIQAMAAMRFADSRGLTLHFHINADVLDTEGTPPHKNVVSLFQGTKHSLVQHEWMNHDQFVSFLKNGVDVGMQVSFSESFCIVAADLVSCGVPTVGSPAVHWLDKRAQANPTSVTSIAAALKTVINNDAVSQSSFRLLEEYSGKARNEWLKAMKSLAR